MEPNYIFCLLAFCSLLAELLLKQNGRSSLSDYVVSMLALQLSVGKQINIQSRACSHDSAFGYHALCYLSDQSLELSFLPSICYQHLKYKVFFFYKSVFKCCGTWSLFQLYSCIPKERPRLFLASKLA